MLQTQLPLTLALNFGGFLQGLLLVAFLVISIVMILVVLIQRPQGGGLSGAFGASADGAGQTALGVKTGDALTTATIVIFLLFLGVAVWLNFAVRPTPPPTQAQMGAAAPAAEVEDEGGQADAGEEAAVEPEVASPDEGDADMPEQDLGPEEPGAADAQNAQPPDGDATNDTTDAPDGGEDTRDGG